MDGKLQVVQINFGFSVDRRTLGWVSEPSDDFFITHLGVPGSVAPPSGEYVFEFLEVF